MRNWIVYKHTSPSGKVYIGITNNITDGGDGVVGIKYSKEHKELLSRTMRVYYNSHRHPLEGFKHSEESKRRMSETQRERWSNPERRKALAQRKSKPIRIISVENNNITHDFPSILVASKLLNVPTTSIGRHLRSGKPYKGYLYKYKDE